MGYFSTPIAVKASVDDDAIRVSVRASETRVDEWTILRGDVRSVLEGYDDDFTGWRGVGELRVRVGRSGGDVAFYDGDDRALLRLGPSEVGSFLAHLRAAYNELPAEMIRGPVPVRLDYLPPLPSASTPVAAPAVTADLEPLRGMMQQVMMAVITLTSDVNRMMQRLAEREAERATAPPVQQVIQVVQAQPVSAPVVTPAAPTESDMFIPSMESSDLSGAGLEAKEKTGSGDELAEAAAALKAAKKRRSTKKKEE
jgi:hypothetical protein